MKFTYKILIVVFVLLIVGLFSSVVIDWYVKSSSQKAILGEDEVLNIQVDAILVLGAGIRSDGSLSPMLKDRLDTAISLYSKKDDLKLILSGDHEHDGYDEVNAMKNYALKKGIPEEDIFLDHAGISTYDSVYRSKYVFGLHRVLIVTQKYHLYRTLYIAARLDLEAFGYSADLREYSFQGKRDVREFLARNKDFLKCIIKPESTYVGDSIDIQGDGQVTNG